MTEFTQWKNSKKLYHIDMESLDGSDFPHSKPTWTFAHKNADGSPAQAIAVVETNPDAHAARITTHDIAGTIEVTVSAVTSSTTVATQSFTVSVKDHPPAAGRAPAFRISQHRNGQI